MSEITTKTLDQYLEDGGMQKTVAAALLQTYGALGQMASNEDRDIRIQLDDTDKIVMVVDVVKLGRFSSTFKPSPTIKAIMAAVKGSAGNITALEVSKSTSIDLKMVRSKLVALAEAGWIESPNSLDFGKKVEALYSALP